MVDLEDEETNGIAPDTGENITVQLMPAQIEQLQEGMVFVNSCDEMSKDWLRWQELCSLLKTFSPNMPKVAVRDQDRRWELVSAYQKSVRRADVQVALKIVSAFDSIPQHRDYLWRRLLVTAGEDVGPADPVLVAFALYCSVVFRKASPEVQQHVLAYLTAQMCSLPHRSRAWCSLCVIGEMAKDCAALSVQAQDIVQSIEQIPAPQNALHAWLKQKSWMTEGMSKYTLIDDLWTMQPRTVPEPPHTVLKGLPSYCYDTHTRVGKRALAISCGLPEVSLYVKKYTPLHKLEVLGWALFFAEGCWIRNELLDPTLAHAELSVVFSALGLPLVAGVEAMELMLLLVNNGKLNDLRNKALIQTYGACAGA